MKKKVFNDTSYSVCSFLFLKKVNNKNITKCVIYPSKKELEFELTKNNNYIISGHIYNLNINEKYKVSRATRLTNNNKIITNLLLQCLDNNENDKIKLRYIDDNEIDNYIDKSDKLSARSYAILVIDPPVDKNKQKILMKDFNKYLNKYRNKYNSLFLTNYRESNSIARKRISFDLAFKICNYLLE